MNRNLHNQLINLLWTAFGFAPMVIYWSRAGSLVPLYVFCIISLAGAFVPPKFYQLSTQPKLYRQLGALKVRALVQDGDWVKPATTSGKQSAAIIRNRAQAKRYLHTLRMYENFHWVCLLLFLLSSGHAIIMGQYLRGCLILLANVIYNVYPILLQQYNRLRITGLFQSRP
ncbi:hypothetical protein GCM10027037_24290 [Mucilaginibacter koreensis]